MCGLLGAVTKSPVNQLLYDGLQVLQHRGQDAAGIVTADGDNFQMHKGGGLVRVICPERRVLRIAAIRRRVRQARLPRRNRCM